MRLPTELRQDGWNLLPRPHHLRAHPGPHNMAEGHQGWSKRPTNWFEISRTLMPSVRTALSRGQVGRGREGLTHRPSSSTSARRVGHQVVRETIPLFLDVAIPCSDYNLSCSSSTRRTSMCGTKLCNSSESSATSMRASTNQISSKCR